MKHSFIKTEFMFAFVGIDTVGQDLKLQIHISYSCVFHIHAPIFKTGLEIVYMQYFSLSTICLL